MAQGIGPKPTGAFWKEKGTWEPKPKTNWAGVYSGKAGLAHTYPKLAKAIGGRWSIVASCMGRKQKPNLTISWTEKRHATKAQKAGDKAKPRGLYMRAERKMKPNIGSYWTKKHPSNAWCVHRDWGPALPLQVAVFYSGSSGWDCGSFENHCLVVEG